VPRRRNQNAPERRPGPRLAELSVGTFRLEGSPSQNAQSCRNAEQCDSVEHHLDHAFHIAVGLWERTGLFDCSWIEFYGIFLRKRPATNAAIYSKFVSDFANPDLFYSDEQRFTTCGACSRNCTQHNRSWQWPQLMVTNIWSSSIVAYLLICKRRSPYGVLFGRRGLLSHLNREYNPAFED
jgi:hypothetical protein